MPESYFASGFWFGVLVAVAGSVIIILWVGLALAAGRVAKRRGYSRTGGIAAGIFTGPLAVAGFALLPSRRRARGWTGRSADIATQQRNVELVRRSLEWDQDVLDEHVTWHFQSPYREFVLHTEGRYEFANAWLNIHEGATGLRQRAAAIWPLGDDLVVAHVEVAMTGDNVPRQDDSVVVYRLADGAVIEGFDIPSASLLS
jgi:hypothetical protein